MNVLLVHGRETTVIRKERAINLLIVRYHEDALRVLAGLEYKQRVTELKAFQPFRNIDEVREYLINLGYVEAHSET
jgi:vacuolar-type H+-ATPase subunit C/Vma6